MKQVLFVMSNISKAVICLWNKGEGKNCCFYFFCVINGISGRKEDKKNKIHLFAF